MGRTGKIARLPEWIREEVNRGLREGTNGRELVEWLNSQRDVQEIMDAEFAGAPIREQNLSDWRKGGYREWLAQRLAFEDGIQMCERVRLVARDSWGPLTDNLVAIVGAHYAHLLNNAMQKGTNSLDFKTLRAICNDVVALRRRDQEDKWLNLEQSQQDFDKEHSKVKYLKGLDREIAQLMEFLDRRDPKIKESWFAFREELGKRAHGTEVAAAKSRGEPWPPPEQTEK